MRKVVAAPVMALALAGVLQGVHAARSHLDESLAPICSVQTVERAVALTFDDGPDPRYTHAVVRLLAASDARATFFVIGERAVAHPDEVEAVLAAGDELANHSWSHARLTDLRRTQALLEIGRTSKLLTALGGSELVRAPFGEVPGGVLEDIRSAGLVPVHWSVALDRYVGDPDRTPVGVARALADDIDPGDIVLAHDADDGGVTRGRAMAVLRILVPMLRADGVRITTVGELLHLGSPVAAVPRAWFWQSGFTCPDA